MPARLGVSGDLLVPLVFVREFVLSKPRQELVQLLLRKSLHLLNNFLHISCHDLPIMQPDGPQSNPPSISSENSFLGPTIEIGQPFQSA